MDSRLGLLCGLWLCIASEVAIAEDIYDTILWPGPAYTGMLSTEILAVSHAFASLPGTATTVIDDVTYGFKLGSVIRLDATPYFYHLEYVAGVTEWLPLGGGTVINQSQIWTNPTNAASEQDLSLPTAFASRQQLVGIREYGPEYEEVIAQADVQALNSVLFSVDAAFGSDYSTWAKVADYSEAIGGATESYTITHGLGGYVLVQVFEDAEPYNQVLPEIKYVDANNVQVSFDEAPSAGAYRVNVLSASFTQLIGDGTAKEFVVSTTDSTRNTFIQLYEASGDKTLVSGAIAHRSVASVTIAFEEAPAVDAYLAVVGQIGSISTGLTDLFIMKDLSNAEDIGPGNFGNTDVHFYGASYNGDGSNLVNVHAEFIRDYEVSEEAATNNYYLYWDATAERIKWGPGDNAFYYNYINGSERIAPSDVYDSFRWYFDNGLVADVDVPNASARIMIDPAYDDAFVRLDGSTPMENLFSLGGHDLISVNNLRFEHAFVQGYVGTSVPATQFIHDLYVEDGIRLIMRSSNLTFTEGLLTGKTPTTDDTILGTFMPYDNNFYEDINEYSDPNAFYHVAGDQLEGTMDANSNIIDDVTALNIRADGQLQLPIFDAADAPDPSNATPWLQEKLPDRGEAFFKQTSSNWYFVVRLDNELSLQRMATLEEMAANAEARAYIKMCQPELGAYRYIAAVTRWPL